MFDVGESHADARANYEVTIHAPARGIKRRLYTLAHAFAR